MKAEENIIITFALRNPRTGESMPPHKLECKGEGEILLKVDELTRLVKADLNLSSVQISTDLDQRLGKITTSSPEAYRFFVEGVKLNIQGDFAQSVESLKKAVALDPEFAMAWRSMAVAYANMGNSANFEKYIRKALEFSDRVSEREFLEIQGLAEKNAAKKIEIFNKLIELYPENPGGHQRLGSTYVALEEWDRALEHLEWGYRASKENPILVSNLSELYLAKGMYDQAKGILEEYLRTHPDNPFLRYDLALAHLSVGEFDRAIAEADRAYVLSPTEASSIVLRGDILLCRGELKKAEEEYRRLLKPEETLTSIYGWQRLSCLDSLQGKFGQSVKDLEQALKFAQRVETKYDEVAIRNCLSYAKMIMGRLTESLEEADAALKVAAGLESTETSYLQFIKHWTSWPLLMRGFCHVQMNSLEKASRIAEEIQALNLYRAERRWHLYLLGLIELKRKNNAKAIEFLKEALSLEPYQWAPEASNSAFFLEALARAYFESGDLENARKTYEEITRLTTGRIRYGDIYARSFYMLGKTGEAQRDSVRARENYQKFLDLWKDADPGLPEVTEAKARLAQLKAN
jgi:tetratricopeptide (TPR) repeat protein